MYSQRARSSERGFASGAPRADIESKSREQTPAHACHENDGARRPWRPCGSNPRDCQDRRRWTRRGKRQSRWTRAVCNERRFQQGRLQLGRATCGRAAVSSASRLQQGRLQQGLLRDAGLERATLSKPGAVSTRKEGTAKKAQRRSHSKEGTTKERHGRKGTAKGDTPKKGHAATKGHAAKKARQRRPRGKERRTARRSPQARRSPPIVDGVATDQNTSLVSTSCATLEFQPVFATSIGSPRWLAIADRYPVGGRTHRYV